jgi:hypothetical protein
MAPLPQRFALKTALTALPSAKGGFFARRTVYFSLPAWLIRKISPMNRRIRL